MMRPLLKAATYLLYCNPASSLVLPSPTTFDPVRPAEPILEYVLSSSAQLKFQLNNVDTTEWNTPVLDLNIGTTAKVCAETNITLNGQALVTKWTGTQGTGEGRLEAYKNAPVSWTVSCLWDPTDPSDDDDLISPITHLLTLTLKNEEAHKTTPAFTISYRQFKRPSILRFEPRYHDPPTSNAAFPEWRTATFPFSSASPTVAEPLHESPLSGSPLELTQLISTNRESSQKTLGMKIKDTAKNVMSHLKSVVDKYCPEKAKEAAKAPQKATQFDHHQNETRSEEVHHDELDESDQVLTILGSPSTVEPHPAAETRSLHTVEPTPSSVEFSPYQQDIPHTFILHVVFFLLLLGSLISWLVIRWRDPRRRAERAARREERRTRRLYKRAACRQKYATKLWKFRVRWGLASPEALRYDEKSRRVDEQEKVLEEAVKDDIQALRDAHRAVSSMANVMISSQVEEGRGGYVYEEDGYGRRRLRSTRSLATLPEYQSDGSRPPSYRSRRGSGTDFNSDSSVVSTSPRISRDGTNSDLDEKIDELDLSEGRPLEVRRV